MLLLVHFFASFPPALAMATLAKESSLNPFLLVHPNCLPDLARIKWKTIKQ